MNFRQTTNHKPSNATDKLIRDMKRTISWVWMQMAAPSNKNLCKEPFWRYQNRCDLAVAWGNSHLKKQSNSKASFYQMTSLFNSQPHHPNLSPFYCGLTCSWGRKGLPSNFLFFLSYASLDQRREQLKQPSHNRTHICAANCLCEQKKLHFQLLYHKIFLKRWFHFSMCLTMFHSQWPRGLRLLFFLLLFGAESFLFQFAIQKFKDQDI